MSAIPIEMMQFQVSAHTKKSFEDEAERLHLSPSAYLSYLVERAKPGVDVARLDKMVGEVFGKFGPAMRKLAQ